MILLDYCNTMVMKLTMDKRQELLNKTKNPIERRVVDEEREINLKDMRNNSAEAVIINTELAKDGTPRTYCLYHPLPCRFLIDQDTVSLTAIYKRFVPLIAKNLKRKGLLGQIITILALRMNIKVMSEWFEYVFGLKRYLLKEQHYSQPVKEIRRVLRGRLDENILNALTLILEYDSAYRYRIQDVLPLLDKSKLTNIFSIAREFERLFKILIERDYCPEEKVIRYGNIKNYIIFAMLLFPKIKKEIISTLKEINLDEIKFNEEDLYWTNQFGVYNFRGLTWDQRKLENKQKYGSI